MIPKGSQTYRLNRHNFQSVLRGGRKLKSKYFVLLYLSTENASARVGIITTKKIGNAVTRNKVRRRIKAIMQGYVKGADHQDIVIIPSYHSTDWKELDYQHMKEDLLSIVTNL